VENHVHRAPRLGSRRSLNLRIGISYVGQDGGEFLQPSGFNCRKLALSPGIWPKCERRLPFYRTQATVANWITERMGDNVMARAPYATQINLRFRNSRASSWISEMVSALAISPQVLQLLSTKSGR
jgi:hypothetical protein